MNKRILALVGVVALVGLLMPAVVFSAEGTVSCTVTITLVSINVTDGEVDYGALALGATANTTDLGQTQTVTNNGTVTEDFSIKSSDATRGGGTTWELVTDVPGLNEFKHEFSMGGVWTAMPADNDFITMVLGVSPDFVVPLDLQITMPGTTTDPQEHSITVTVMAVEHT